MLYRTYFFFIIAIFFLLLAVSIVITRLRRIDYCVVHIEGDVSCDIRKDVEEYIRESWLLFNKKLSINPEHIAVSIEQLCDRTLHLFSWIKNIEVMRMPYKSGAYITIVPYRLLYIINEKYVVTEAGNLLPKHIFKSFILRKLKHIWVIFENNSIQLSDSCKKFIFLLHATASALLSDYIGVWENENRVWFFDKSNTQYAILANPSQLPKEKGLRAVFFVKEELVKQKKLETGKVLSQGKLVGQGKLESRAKLDSLKQQKIWVADIRFKDQIVVSQKMGPQGGVSMWGK